MSVSFEETAYERLERTQRYKKPQHYRDRYVVWREVIGLILDGKNTRQAILRKEHGGYVWLREHVRSMVESELLRLDLIYSKRYRGYTEKYSITEKGSEFYTLMGHLMEACPKT